MSSQANLVGVGDFPNPDSQEPPARVMGILSRPPSTRLAHEFSMGLLNFGVWNKAILTSYQLPDCNNDQQWFLRRSFPITFR